VNLALGRPAVVCRLADDLADVEEVVDLAALGIVADQPSRDTAAVLAAGSGVNPAVGPGRLRPARVVDRQLVEDDRINFDHNSIHFVLVAENRYAKKRGILAIGDARINGESEKMKG